ncbi:hypothetical protein AVO41_05695 [Thiomicrospira sp. WB1]|nr:hypothetical protein AVO41_05695 [Thiomicrospira sp. WB1]
MFGGCATVNSQALSENEYLLTTYYDEPPRTLQSRALTSKAESLCPVGVSVRSRHATKAAEFGKDDVSCVSGNCRYRLTWRVVCTDVVPQESSWFGDT